MGGFESDHLLKICKKISQLALYLLQSTTFNIRITLNGIAWHTECLNELGIYRTNVLPCSYHLLTIPPKYLPVIYIVASISAFKLNRHMYHHKCLMIIAPCFPHFRFDLACGFVVQLNLLMGWNFPCSVHLHYLSYLLIGQVIAAKSCILLHNNAVVQLTDHVYQCRVIFILQMHATSD